MWLTTLKVGAAHASLRHRNRAKITIFVYGQKPYHIRYDFRGGAKAIQYDVNMA